MALRSFGTSLAGTTTGGTGVKNGVTAPIDWTAAPRARFTRDPRLTSAQCGNIAPADSPCHVSAGAGPTSAIPAWGLGPQAPWHSGRSSGLSRGPAERWESCLAGYR
jgi:hypothetical protein